MLIKFETATAMAQARVTDWNNTAGAWRHFEISGTAVDETTARGVAEEIKQLFTYGRETRWRVYFEYKPTGNSTHLYARFSVKRQNMVAKEPNPENIEPNPLPLL